MPTSGLNMNEPEGLIQSCTCPDYQRRRRPCKHIYLLDRLYAFMRVDYYSHLEQVEEDHVDMQGSLVQDVLGWIPLPVKQYIYAERARDRDKERRPEQQRAKTVADYEKEAIVLWQQLGVSLSNQQRVCSLEYYRDFVAGLRNVVRDSQGLHT